MRPGVLYERLDAREHEDDRQECVPVEGSETLSERSDCEGHDNPSRTRPVRPHELVYQLGQRKTSTVPGSTRFPSTR